MLVCAGGAEVSTTWSYYSPFPRGGEYHQMVSATTWLVATSAPPAHTDIWFQMAPKVQQVRGSAGEYILQVPQVRGSAARGKAHHVPYAPHESAFVTARS